jgi:hypothetical protein
LILNWIRGDTSTILGLAEGMSRTMFVFLGHETRRFTLRVWRETKVARSCTTTMAHSR